MSCSRQELFSRNFQCKAFRWLSNLLFILVLKIGRNTLYYWSGATKGCYKKSRGGPSIKQWRRIVIDAPLKSMAGEFQCTMQQDKAQDRPIAEMATDKNIFWVLLLDCRVLAKRRRRGCLQRNATLNIQHLMLTLPVGLSWTYLLHWFSL